MRTHPFTVLAVLASMLLVGSLAMDARVESPASLSVSPTPYSASARAMVGSIEVNPDNAASGTKYVSTSGHTATFTLIYEIEMGPNKTFNLSCSGTNGIGCSVQSTVVLTPYIPKDVNVTFSTGSSLGTGYVYLTASASGLSDQGSRYYTIDAPMTVNPLSVPSSVIQHADGQTGTFTVLNAGIAGTVTMTCEWGGSPCTPNPASQSFGSGQLDTVTITFDAGAIPTSYSLKLTATRGSETDWDAGNVTVSEFLSVNAAAQKGEAYAVPDVQRTDTFVVRFPAQSASSFAMSVACPGGSKARSCSVNASDDTMSVGDTPANVRVTYTAGANGDTSSVTLTATKVGSTSINQAGALQVVATSNILLSVADANPEMAIDRGDCLEIAAGAGSIVCDDYQFVYPFMPSTRMSRARQLGLTFSSRLFGPTGVIGANFVLPPGSAKPDSIRATLSVNGDTIRTQSYGSSLYESGVKTRIAFDWADWNERGTKLFTYAISFQSKSGGTWGSSVVASGRTLSLDHYQPYGRAWWVAGLERLSVHGDTLLWTGADASGGVYLKSASIWVRQTRAVPDTIVSSGGAYIRKPLGGGQGYFTSVGLHDKTIDQNGNETDFNYTTIQGWDRLTSVELPTRVGTDTVYDLHYSPSTGVLDSVRARTGSNSWARYRMYSQLHQGYSPVIDSIAAPDGTMTRFVHGSGLIYVIVGRATIRPP